MGEESTVTKLELPTPPTALDIDVLQYTSLDTLVDDAADAMSRYTKHQQAAQQAQQGMQQAQIELMGTSKAMEVFINTIVKSKGIAGQYIYDKSKKQLVLKQ
ncbi:MAG: hypothetical protein ACYDG3_13420 [Bacillati bacterium]